MGVYGVLKRNYPDLIISGLVEFDVGVDLSRLFKRELPRRLLDLVIRHDLPPPEAFVVASFPIYCHTRLYVFLETLLGCRGKGEFERSEDNVLVNVLLPRKRINQHQ